MNNYESAKAQLLKILNPDDLLLDEEELLPYSQSTTGINRKIKFVIFPKSTEEVSRCVKVAHQHQLKIFPISRGNNHGYNSASPLSDDCMIISLQKMDRITNYKPYFDAVELEPGVTFKQLYQYLAENGNEHIVSGIGGSAYASVIGNIDISQ